MKCYQTFFSVIVSYEYIYSTIAKIMVKLHCPKCLLHAITFTTAHYFKPVLKLFKKISMF